MYIIYTGFQVFKLIKLKFQYPEFKVIISIVAVAFSAHQVLLLSARKLLLVALTLLTTNSVILSVAGFEMMI